jgi:membrane protein
MSFFAAPPPIHGIRIDPPPKEPPGYAELLDRSTVGGVAVRAWHRYSYANVGLLAAGTAYYLILAVFSVMAFAYGLFAVLGADELAASLTSGLESALPGLVGEDGIDPADLRQTGQTAGIIGLLLLLYSSLAAVAGASRSMHLIFGAPPDPRSFVKARARHALILLVVAPLIAVSFATLGLSSTLSGHVLDLVGLNTGAVRTVLNGVGIAVGLAIDFLIMWILLGRLGGIRPFRRPRFVASLVGAVLVGVVKQLLDLLIAWSLQKPGYGAFTVPFAALFVLSLLSTVLYVTASLAAAISDKDVPLEQLVPRDAGSAS